MRCLFNKNYFCATIVLTILGGLFLIGFPQKVAADSGHLVINEIYPNADKNENEWIELYNPSDENFDLSGWFLCDNTCDAENRDGAFVFNTLRIIPADGYVLLEKTEDFTFSLNNNGDKIVLYSEGGSIVDAVAYGNYNDGDTLDNAPAPVRRRSLSRVPNGFDSDNDSNDFKVTLPTKGIEYSKPVFSDEIYISEIMPTPGIGINEEYIEILNAGSASVDLSGWQLEDGGGSKFSFPDDTFSHPREYLVFLQPQTKITLNDDGDTICLYDPNGDVKSLVQYSKGVRGESYSLIDGKWQWSITATKGSANILTIKNDDSNINFDLGDKTISEIRKEENGTLVSIEGKVTVLPGKLSDQYFYIQDELSGIQVYSYYKKFPRLAEGDMIKVVGELSETAGERRVKIKSENDILIISNSQPLQPKEIEINEINENLEGTYVKVEGHVTKTSGQTFFVRGGDGREIKVIIKSKTGVKKPKIRKGDTVVIAGIVSQYKDEYRILPFKTEDVKILTSGYLPKAGGSGIIAIAMGSTFYLIWIFFQKKKKRPCLLVRR